MVYGAKNKETAHKQLNNHNLFYLLSYFIYLTDLTTTASQPMLTFTEIKSADLSVYCFVIWMLPWCIWCLVEALF